MKSWWGDRRGNVAVWFALGSLALAGLGAGALTMARLNGSATRLQDLADGAALAAVVQAQDPTASEADIRDAAARFGRTATAEGTPEFEPAAMSVALVRRSPAEVTVTLDQEVRTILSAFVGRDSIAIQRRATAQAGPERLTCLHVLDPSAGSALKLQGNPDLQAPGCRVQVNSTAPNALHAQGSPSAQVEATYVAGAASPARNWRPAPLTDQPQRADPLAGRIAWPSLTADCRRQDGPEAVLRPGRYCDGLLIGRGARLEPGLYVIESGGVRVEGRGSRAEGVTLVLLDPAGEFDIRGGSSLSLSAPTSGPWAGVAVAARPGTALPTSRLTGDLQLEGTLYLPGHKLLLQGSPTLGGPSEGTRALIVRQLTLQGAPKLSLAGGYPSGGHGAPRLIR